MGALPEHGSKKLENIMFTGFAKWMSGHKAIRAGLWVILGLLVLSGLTSWTWTRRVSLPPGTESSLIAAFGACFLILAGLLILARRIVVQPSESMIKMGRSVVDKDCASLKVALNEMTQGNMSIRMKMESKPLEPVSDPVLNRFVGILNDIASHLHDAAREYNAITDVPCRRLCYVGADSFLEGWRCGEAMGDLLQGKGQVGIIVSVLTASNCILRRKGLESALQEKYPDITVVDVLEDHENIDDTYQCTMDLIKRFPHLTGVYIAHGATANGAARAVTESRNVQKVKIVTHDLTDETMRCIQQGTIAATLGQDPFAQGYDPAIHLYNHLVAGWQPPAPRLLTQLDVVTPANYKQYWQEGKGMIQSQVAMERLARPVDRLPEKPLKIAVLGTEGSAFWKPVKEGALAAAKKLQPMNATVDWILPYAAGEEFNIDLYCKAVRKAVEDGYQALAMIVYYQDMVPVVNETVDKGVPVVSYNSEPFSMRSLVYTIMQQADKLMGLSENLASNAQQVSMATGQINTSMNQIAQGAVSQNTQVKQTEQVLESLLSNIDKVSREAGESATSAEETAKAVVSGTDAMDKTLGGIKSIEQSVEATSQIVDELRRHSDRIDAVVELINDIASQVNVLSLNAAIEATRAGEYGKGFMVVSNEIRKLARNTADATGEVTKLVGTVQTGIRSVGKSMQEGLEKVQNSAKLTDVAKDALGSIRDMVETNKNRMGKIAAAIVEMQKFSHQVGDAMGGVTSVSERNAQAVEEIRAATEEMNLQFKEVAILARSLENMARSEQELLAKFNVSEK
jgi:methyl-accepting chemotaxis protein